MWRGFLVWLWTKNIGKCLHGETILVHSLNHDNQWTLLNFVTMVADVTIETFVTLTAKATVITLVVKLVVNVGRSSCESRVVLSSFNDTWSFWTDCWKTSQHKMSLKIRLAVGCNNRLLSTFAKAPKTAGWNEVCHASELVFRSSIKWRRGVLCCERKGEYRCFLSP